MRLRTVMSRRIAWCAGRPSKSRGVTRSSTSNVVPSPRSPTASYSSGAGRPASRSRTISLTCSREPGAKRSPTETPTSGFSNANIETQAGLAYVTFPSTETATASWVWSRSER